MNVVPRLWSDKRSGGRRWTTRLIELLPSRRRHCFYEPIDTLLERGPFGFGPVTDEHTVPQHRMHHGADVVEVGMIAASQESPRLGPQHHILPGPRAGSPAHPIANEIGRPDLAGPAGCGQAHGIT